MLPQSPKGSLNVAARLSASLLIIKTCQEVHVADS
jgi:hypothetical protein